MHKASAPLSIVLAILGIVIGALPYPWFFAGLALSLASLGFGLFAYRNNKLSVRQRLFGAYAMGLGSVATVLAGARVAMTLLGLHKVATQL